MQELLGERCHKSASHLSELIGTPITLFDCEKRCFSENALPPFCEQCQKLGCDKSGCVACNTHLYGSNESYRWNGRYIYYCPIGLVFCAAAVNDEYGKQAYSLIAGPFVMGEKSDTAEEIADSEIKRSIVNLHSFTAETVGHLSETLFAVASYSGLTSGGISGAYDQERQLNTQFEIQNESGNSEGFFYPIEYEKQLHDLIVSRDKSGAQALLNELLGYIYFSSNYDLPVIKARVVELVVLLSRAIIDAGADVREIFISNSGYIHDVEGFTSVEQLNVWLTVVMHRFVDYTFNFTGVKHSDVVHKAMNYIKANYSQKITLDDIARHVYLSRSYLSTIFKDETSISITDYVKKIRIEKSKQFLIDHNIRLADIASLCGFEDQSYFTKVFRSYTGVSPKKFRDSGGRAAAEAAINK